MATGYAIPPGPNTARIAAASFLSLKRRAGAAPARQQPPSTASAAARRSKCAARTASSRPGRRPRASEEGPASANRPASVRPQFSAQLQRLGDLPPPAGSRLRPPVSRQRRWPLVRFVMAKYVLAAVATGVISESWLTNHMSADHWRSSAASSGLQWPDENTRFADDGTPGHNVVCRQATYTMEQYLITMWDRQRDSLSAGQRTFRKTA